MGWLMDILFWKQAPGINFAIYAMVCLVGGLALVRLMGSPIAARALWLVPLIALFAITTFVRAEPLTMFLGVAFTLFLMATLALSHHGGRWLEFGLADYAVRLLRLAWSMVSRPFGFLKPALTEEDSERPARSKLWPVLRGLALALPVLLVFGVLLSSADLIFQRELNAVIGLLRLERLPEYVFRLLYMLVAAWALLGVFLHAASQDSNGTLLADRVPAGVHLLGFIESSIVLAGVAVLFAAFVLVQFRYFFGGAENIGLDGFTFAEYARRGYGELMAVAVLSLLLLLGLGTLTRRESIRQQQVFSGLSIAVVVLVGVMLVSAYMRLGLYEMAYGFTRLRTYVHVSLAWLGILLAAVVVLEVARRERWFASALLICSLGFGVSLAALNVDDFIVRQNVDRAQRGQGLDVAHLASLSTDAVPALVRFFASASTLPDAREAVGAALACGWASQNERYPTDWRSFSVSRSGARTALASVGDDLRAYRIETEDWVTTVSSPEGHSFNCTTHPD
jgi:hypothetical protein